MDRVDVAIIGSGFGSAVIAARVASHLSTFGGEPRSVLVIDKGPDHTGAFDPEGDDVPVNDEGNRFQHTYAPGYLNEVADFYTDSFGAYRPGTPSINVIAGRGLGGGSNLYCGVSLKSPTETFEQVRDNRRLWPQRYTRAALNPFYELVEQKLKVRQMAWTNASAPYWQLCTKRDAVFAEGARRVGATAVPLRLADDNDANEGWWTQGQRFEGRQNLTLNYLAEARDAGAMFWSKCEVREILPGDDGGYVVRGIDGRRGRREPFELECRMLFMGAGAVASTGILLRSRDNFTGDRVLDHRLAQTGEANLGQHLSSNGDYGVTGYVGNAYGRDVEGYKGKPMSSFSPSYWAESKFIIIPFHTPLLYFSQGQISSVLPAKHPDATGRGSTTLAEDAAGRPLPEWGKGYKERLQQFGRRTLTMGCLSWDECEGEMRLTDDDRFDVVWRETHPNTEARWSAAATAMRSIYRALGGDMMLDGYRRHGTVNTAHPLGGCRMADVGEQTEGVVDPNGEVFGNPNLFVIDGSMMPSALGVNPSLTIAAVAEFIADKLIRGEGTPTLSERL